MKYGAVVADSKGLAPKPKTQRACNSSSCFFNVNRTYTKSGSRRGNHDVKYPAQSPSGPYSPLASSSNYVVEGITFKASQHKLNGFRPIYHCRHSLDTFISLVSSCEGKKSTHSSPIGYISSTKTSNYDKTIYRCYIPGNASPLDVGDHFVSRDPNCEISAAKKESVLGYF